MIENKKELLKPKTDVVFHSLFRVGNEEITKAIISDILGDKIESIDLDNDKYLIKDYVEEKLGILDLKARFDNGTICNIEVQLSDRGNTVKRFIWYWSKNYSSQLKEGEDYNSLQKNICIMILDYELKEIKEIADCHTEWKIIEKKQRKIILTDVLEIHIIEIPKALKMLKKERKNKIVQWMTFLDNPNNKEVSEIMEENTDIKKAMEKLKEISADDKLRRIAELKEKALLDERSAINYATNKGIEDGKKIGIREERIEIAKKLLKLNIPIEDIIKVTELTKEQIEKIKQ